MSGAANQDAPEGRLFEFPSIEDVERAVSFLFASQLAAELPRRPGQKEVRYGHLLSGEPLAVETPPVESVEQHPAPPATDTRLEDLRRDLDALRAEFDAFRKQFGS